MHGGKTPRVPRTNTLGGYGPSASRSDRFIPVPVRQQSVETRAHSENLPVSGPATRQSVTLFVGLEISVLTDDEGTTLLLY